MWSNNSITINWDFWFKQLHIYRDLFSFVFLTLAPCVGTQRQDTWYSDTGVDLVKTIDKETRESCSWNQCKSASPKPKDKEACESCSWMQWRNAFLLQNFNPQQRTAPRPPVLKIILLSSLLKPQFEIEESCIEALFGSKRFTPKI